MKKSLLLTLLAVATTSVTFAAEDAKECSQLSATVTAEVTAKPSDVLSIVSAQIAANPDCACEIVKAAITASKADKDLVGQIVFTAVTAAPTEATTVAECAVAAAPEAAENVKAALRSAYSDKNPAGKNPDKNPDKNPPAPPTDETPDYGLSPVAIGGVYLVYPGSGSSGPQLVKQNGELGFIGPDGFVPLEQEPPTIIVRPRPPGVIIIVPPTPTNGNPTP
ncbi:MAG: hypothetical protein ACKV19_19340 [Verrucomicrobiales bacterium]